MRKFFGYILAIFICCLFASCEKVVEWVDSYTGEPFAIARFDRLQNELGVTGNFSTMQRMSTEFPGQTQILIEDVLEIGSVTDPDIKDKLEYCLSDTAMLLLMADGEQKFGNMEKLTRQFAKAIKQMHKEFPQLKTPRVYAQFSGLNESVIVSDSLLGFSLDKYLGTDYPVYKKYFYDNQIVSMNPERIVTDCIFFYLKDKYPLPEHSAGTLLDNMVNLGKLNWITMSITGNKRIEDHLGYTSADMEWIRENNQMLLGYVESHKLSTDPQVLRGLLNPISSVRFAEGDSPALLGAWVGYQMVSRYMKDHKRVSLQELAASDNLSEIASSFNFNLD